MECCKRKSIEVVHFINSPGDKLLIKDLKKNKIEVVSTVHDLHPHETNKEWYKELQNKLLLMLNNDQSIAVDRGKDYYDSHFDSQSIRTSLLDIYNTLG